MNIDLLQSFLNSANIFTYEIIENNKASEVYVKTTFVQDDGFRWDTYVPFVDRRAGLNIKTEKELADYLYSLKQYFTKEAMEKWRKVEKKRGLIGGSVTPRFFRILLSFQEEFKI